MTWLLLAGAIVLEVAGTASMKLSDGFSRMAPTAMVFIFYAISFAMLIVVLKRMDLGVTYAIWSGLGTALAAVIGVIWFHEPMGALKIGSLALIILGVVGLHLGEGSVG